MDSKLSGRSPPLIQYSNQSWECHATHQAKYGSPGIFPVVHLSKKSIPIRSIIPKGVVTHMNIDESSYYDPSCHDTVEDLTVHGGREMCFDNQEANIHSHNLLYALKEISRKRIHSENEDFHAHSSKHLRCFPATTPSSPNLTRSAIPSVINPINASLSSARTHVVYPRKSILKRKFYPLIEKTEQKHALTQTDNLLSKITKRKKIVTNKLQRKKLVQIDDVLNESTTASGITQFFKKSPFEVTKKNKLALLLSPLTGSKVKLFSYNTKSDNTESNETELLHSQIKPTSIISPKNKPKHDKHVTFAIPEKENIIDSNSKGETDQNNDNLQQGESIPLSNNEEKQLTTIVYAATESTSENNPNKTDSTSSSVLNTPSSGFSLPAVPINSSITPFDMTEKFPSNVPVIQPNIGSVPSSNVPTSKIGGFKFDFKNNESLQSPQSGSLIPSTNSVKSQFSQPVTNTDSQLIRSSLVNMFSSPTTDSHVTDAFFKNETMVKPKSYLDAIFDPKKDLPGITKFSSNSSQFGANTTVTSVGRSMLLSTGLETSAVATTPILHVPSPTNTLSLGTNQTPPFSSIFGIKPSVPSTGFTSSDFLNTTPKSVSTTSFNINPSSVNTGTGLSSTSFSSPMNLTVPATTNPTSTTTGFSFGNSFTSPIFPNNQFKSTPSVPTTGFGDNKSFTESTVKANIFNITTSTENNFFGARNNNSMGSAFESTSQGNLFTAPTSLAQPQPEAFAKGANSDIFSLGMQNNAPGKFNLSDTNNLFSAVPNSAFNSVASTLPPPSNAYSFSSNVGFNTTPYNNNTVGPNVDISKIFNIGSGTYSKARPQLKGRRRT